MIRSDIEVIHKKETIIVQSKTNFFSFSRNHTGTIKAYCTVDLTSEMITDIILSGIVSIMNKKNSTLLLSPKFGYDILKMQEVIIAIFEKFNL